jgi:glycerol-3-phosphate dehydrogenase
MTREEILAALRKQPEISVLIVGAGINGIGTFRDLALNGVDVLLIDRADFCSGASAASSHMAHGGIRYLENGEFRLVREAVQERNHLIQNAPHLVQPLPTTIPIFKTFSGLLNAPLKFLGLLDRPSERGALVIKIGLMLYDAYSGSQRVVPPHRFLGRAESLAQWGKLNPAVVNTATYFDGAILEPERLGLELVLDAEAEERRAQALNYVSLVRGSGQAVTLRDELTGSTLEVKPRLLVNAAGPWIDAADTSLGHPTHFIGGTKGSHLVLDHSELRAAIGDHEFFFENKDGRIVLVFPLYDRVLIGTSDIPVEDPDSVRCTEEEVDYFLEMLGRVFPSIKVRREDIVFRFSGVRPLAAVKSKTTGQITRDHEIQVLPSEETGLAFPVFALVGGKWTSFRAFSEQVTDKALAALGRHREKDTKGLPIGGGRGYPETTEERKVIIDGIRAYVGLAAERANSLFERYGTRAEDVATFLARLPDGPLRTIPGYSRRELAFIAETEKVVHLDDLLLRRSMLAMLGRLKRESIPEIAEVVGEALSWDHRRISEEVTRSLAILTDVHNARLPGA